MSNPASELLSIFNAWTEAGSAPANGRQMGEQVGVDRHIEAMRNLIAIDAELSTLEARGSNVGVYRQAVAAWIRFTIAYPHGWTTDVSRPLANEGRFDLLEALADRLEASMPTAHIEGAADLPAFLNGIVDLVNEDSAISAELRAYILELVQEIREALENYKVTGQFDSASRLRDLWIALGAASSESSEHKTKWKSFRDTVIRPATVGLIVNAPTTVLRAIEMIADAPVG